MAKKTNKKSTVSVEGSMFLYDKPEYLSHRIHGNLGWRTPSDQYAFAKTVSSIPLVASEIQPLKSSIQLFFLILSGEGQLQFSPRMRAVILL